jgi:two-component system, NarL family, response regulator NreC
MKPNKKINVLICDDHSVFREGVRSILSGEPDMIVVGQASNGAEGVKKARELSPDVILMDIAMPVMRGFDATRRVVKLDPQIRVLMLTVYDDEDLVARCLSAGAAGYVLKDAPPEQLVYAIRTVARGERYLSPKALKGVIGGLTVGAPQVSTRYELLSDREREILVLLAEGDSLKEVASLLNLSVKTVDAHKYNIMRKLDVHDRTELIRFAIRQKLIAS